MQDMTKWKRLSHTIYHCKYHVVWYPKYRYKIQKGILSEFVEQTLRMLCDKKKKKEEKRATKGNSDSFRGLLLKASYYTGVFFTSKRIGESYELSLRT